MEAILEKPDPSYIGLTIASDKNLKNKLTKSELAEILDELEYKKRVVKVQRRGPHQTPIIKSWETDKITGERRPIVYDPLEENKTHDFALKRLPEFENWYPAFLIRIKTNLEDLDDEQLKRLALLAKQINYKFKNSYSQDIKFSLLIDCEGELSFLKDKSIVLKYIQRKINDVEFGIRLELDVDNFADFLPKFKNICQKRLPILDQFKKVTTAGPDLVKTVERIDRNIEAVAKNKYELQSENEELKRLAADGLFNFLTQVDADDFRYFIAICMQGDRAKAAKALKINQRTFYDRINAWPAQGQQYKRMYQMISSVKKLKTKNISLPGSIQYGGAGNAPENPKILTEILQKIQQSNSSAYPNILQEVLDAILDMNQNNWQAIRNELIPVLREEIPQ